MTIFLIEGRRRIQFVKRAINFDPLKPLLAQLKEFLFILAFAIANNRRQKIAARALWDGHHLIDHILDLLRFDGLACGGTKGRTSAGKKQPHIIINLSHRAHGRARIFRRCLLLNRNGRAEAADMINVRFFHHIKELAGIGAEAFDIAALPFGIDRIKGKRGFP